MVSVNDIFNRPPTISEDTLQYTLYLPPEQSDRVSATTFATLLTEHAQALLPGHIWHRDAFELKVAPDPEGSSDVWVLEGRMRVGDCIDDEWCTVWLLRELSSKWDVAICVFDSDGEFLLIEAAEELPSWVTPTNAENRVWIHNSRLHLIPLSHVSPPSSKKRRRHYPSNRDSDDEEEGNDEEAITAADAVKLVRDPLEDTIAPDGVEAVVWKRISGYPAASRQHMHVSKAYLPIDLAKALAANPLLVQKAVETFYTRDGLQLRAAQKMTRFPPEPAILSSVKMSRTAYAQLLGQKFHPPKVFGRWAEREGTKEWKWRDVGMKIACGFEMLYQESKKRKDALSANFDGSPASLEAVKDSLRRNQEYTEYIQRLVSAGYFKGEVQGSQLWATLENQAALAFVAARRDDDASRPSFASAVQAALGSYTDEFVIAQEEEDSDEWLNVDAADFDALLEKTMGSTKGKEKATDAMDVDGTETDEDRVTKAQAARLHTLAQQVEEFVEGKGDLEGARFADEGSSDDEDGEDEDSDIDLDESDIDLDESESGSDADAEGGPHQAPTASQLTPEQRAARQEAMDRLVPGIDPSEYGKMPPSFHSNSQRVAPATVATDVRDDVAASSASSAQSRPIRPPILPRDKFDGVDSDDETDEEDEEEDEEDEEEHPQVVGEIEIDMAEEQEGFIEFARQALGVTDEQWESILQDRRDRGAFVPANIDVKSKSGAKPSRPSSHPDQYPEDGGATLDSFEAVMKAMDAELARSRSERTASAHPPSSQEQGKGKSRDDAPTSVDIEAAMEEEFERLLEREADDSGEEGNEPMDYQLIKNFLESFKSQGGLSGPVGSLVGRLQQGWSLPRDES